MSTLFVDRKICTKCGILKSFDEFYVRVREGCKNRPKSCCKECSKKKSMAWSSKNREKANEGVRKWRKKYPERARASCEKWQKNNKDRVRFLAREVARKRRNTPKGKLHDNVACLIYQSLKRGSKAGRKWESIVGYDVDQLKLHLEKQFKEGMSWENYGSVWSIDHILPQSVFNFEKPEHMDFQRCWSLKNLQPLICGENSRKKAKIDKPFQPYLAI